MAGYIDGPARLKLLLYDSVSRTEDGWTFLKDFTRLVISRIV